MRGFLKDLQIAARGLLRAPVFTVVAVVTLVIGIGGATAIMTILDSVVLQPLPYPAPGELVKVENTLPGVGEGTSTWTRSCPPSRRWGCTVGTVGTSTLRRGQSGPLDGG